MAKKSIRKIPYAFICLSYALTGESELSTLNFIGFQTSSTNMHSLSGTVYITFYFFNVGIPNTVGSSMRMAYVVTEMNALATNFTFSHFYTS